MKGKRKITKRIAAWLLCLAMVLTTVNLPVFTKEVKAAPAPTTKKPGVTVFATKTDLVNPNNFTLHTDNGSGVAQKVNFGNGKTWYIAGAQHNCEDGDCADTTPNELVLICDPSKSFDTKVFYARDNLRTYESSMGTYEDATALGFVYPNHYGASDIRDYLTKLYGDYKVDVFSNAEQKLMKDTTVYTQDTRNKSDDGSNLVYSTSDKLYLAYGGYERDYITVGANDNSNLNGGIKIGLRMNNSPSGLPYASSGQFWLRAPYDKNENFVLNAYLADCVNGDPTYCAYPVVPAFNMNLSSVLFTSAAIAASSNATLSDAMTFRLDGSDKVLSTAVYDNDGIKVTKVGDDEYIYVLYKDETGDKVWSKAITGDMNIYKDCLDIDSFENCKIWIEKKVAKDNLTYAVMATSGSSGVTGHSYGEYSSNDDATCVVDGTKTAKCNYCNATDTKEDEGSATGNHDFSVEDTSVEGAMKSGATCTEGAMYYKSCADCGAVSTSDDDVFEDGEPLGHEWGKYNLDGDQTCTNDGHKTAECTREGCSEKNTIVATGAAFGHSFTEYFSNGDATTEQDGTKTAECDYGCGATDTVIDEGSRIIDPCENHDFSAQEYLVDEDGKHYKVCSFCGAETAHEAHTGGIATCQAKAVCSTCKKEYGALAAHTWDDGKITTAATCKVEGVKSFHCTTTGCTETKTEKIAVNSDNHVNTEVVGKKAATCTEKGYTGDTHCKDCDYTEGGAVIKATGHTWDAGKVTTEPTVTAEGVKTFTCSDCGTTKIEVVAKLPAPKKDAVIEDKAGNDYKVANPTKKEVTYKAPANKKDKTVTIPANVEIDGVTYKVTKVDDKAFKGNTTVTKVVVPSSVTTIGAEAFSGCKNLTTVSIPKNVTQIGKNAFKGCAKLTKVTLPAKASKIGASAFDGCKKMKTITIKSAKLTNKSVSAKAFKGLSKKVTIKVPKKQLKAYKKLLKKKGFKGKVKA